MQTNTQIPKIIHYCWFGENKKNYILTHCISTFYKLMGGGVKLYAGMKGLYPQFPINM